MMKLQIIVILIMSFSIKAQTPEKDLDRLIQTYSNLTSFNSTVDYYIYSNHTTNKISEKAYGSFQKKGKNIRVMRYGTEFIQNNKYVLVKDDSSNVIVLTLPQKNQSSNFDVEKIFSYYSKVEFIKSKKPGQKGIRLYFKKDNLTEYEMADAYFNVETNLLDEIILYYLRAYDVSLDPKKVDYQKPKIRMVYTKFDTNPVFEKGIFSVSKYVNLSSKGKNTLKKNYNSYEFHDQTH